MASIAEIQAQRDKLNAAIDAWTVSHNQATADATAAASAGAIATTAQQTADASAQLASDKKAQAAQEAQLLADMFGSDAPTRRRGKA